MIAIEPLLCTMSTRSDGGSLWNHKCLRSQMFEDMKRMHDKLRVGQDKMAGMQPI